MKYIIKFFYVLWRTSGIKIFFPRSMKVYIHNTCEQRWCYETLEYEIEALQIALGGRRRH